MKIVLYIFLVIIMVGSLILVFDESKFVNRLEIIKLLQQKKYKDLEMKFVKIQQNFEQGNIEDVHVQYAYQAFMNSDPSFKEIFEEWIKQAPESWVAHMAYANYEIVRAWHSRGIRFSNKTSEEQFFYMRQHFLNAKNHIGRVLELKPNLLPAYEGLLHIAKSRGDRVQAKKVLLKALKYKPDSYSVRQLYLESMEPKWGGSLQEITRVLEKAKQYNNSNPHLKLLDGYLEYMKGEVIRGNDCKGSIEWYNAAIKKADNPDYYIGRASGYRCLEEYDKSLADMNTAIEMGPNYSGWFYLRGKIYFKRKEYQLAVNDFSRALSLDSYKPTTLRYRGQSYYLLKKYDLAIKDFMKAKYYGNNDRNVHRLLGYAYHNNKEYLKAADAFKEAILLGDQSPSTWYQLAISEWSNDNCDFLNSLKSYKNLCSIKGGCEKIRLKWVSDSFKSVVKKKQCIGYY